MCGIAGIIQLPAAGYSREQLQKMTLSLAHRGPDGEGLGRDVPGITAGEQDDHGKQGKE